MIRELEEETGATIEIEDDGTVRVGASDTASMELARERILAIGFPPESVAIKRAPGAARNTLPGETSQPCSTRSAASLTCCHGDFSSARILKNSHTAS